jgi:hypothetical protein
VTSYPLHTHAQTDRTNVKVLIDDDDV